MPCKYEPLGCHQYVPVFIKPPPPPPVLVPTMEQTFLLFSLSATCHWFYSNIDVAEWCIGFRTHSIDVNLEVLSGLLVISLTWRTFNITLLPWNPHKSIHWNEVMPQNLIYTADWGEYLAIHMCRVIHLVNLKPATYSWESKLFKPLNLQDSLVIWIKYIK